MSKFSECKTSNCIITGNEHFLERNGINLFDAIIVTVEGYKENSVKLITPCLSPLDSWNIECHSIFFSISKYQV